MSQEPLNATQATHNSTADKSSNPWTGAQWLVLGAAVGLTVLLRLVNSPWLNFGSMIALTLLCGSIKGHRALLLLPLCVRLLTDVIIEARTGYGFFPSWPFDYSAYVLILAIGHFVPTRHALKVLGGTLASVGVYFVISNLGVWMLWPDTYPRTFGGLVTCFVKAIPFVRGTIYGNLLIAPVFFAAWNYAGSTAMQHQSVNAAASES